MTNILQASDFFLKKEQIFKLLLGLAFISEILRTKTKKKYSYEMPQNTYMFLHPFETPVGGLKK